MAVRFDDGKIERTDLEARACREIDEAAQQQSPPATVVLADRKAQGTGKLDPER